MTIDIQIPGLAELLADIDKFPATVQKEVGMEIQASGLVIQGNAIRNAPLNLGFLRSSIVYKKVNPLEASVSVGANYGAYIEFGTGSFVSIPATPPEADAVAFAAKGRGIRQRNKEAHPFFFPAMNEETPKLVDRIKIILEESINGKP